LVDIANHTNRFGHLRGLMCFASERAIRFIPHRSLDTYVCSDDDVPDLVDVDNNLSRLK
jgi:hypothetical protein